MLESKRLIFRKVEDDDFDVIAKMMRDEGVRRIWGHYFSDDDVRAWIERRKKGYQDHGIDYLLAIQKETGEVVGQIGILRENVEGKDVWGIGYILNGNARGCGYATEGAKGMEEDAFYREKTTGKVYPGAALMEAGILRPAAVSEYEAYQIELERV